MSNLSDALRREVTERANHQCEYCQLPSNVSFYPHEIDHIIAQKHQGETVSENLALACWRCNRHKGSDLGSFDPKTAQFSFLFNPRTQNWPTHFAPSEGLINGLTPEGRTTARLLQINRPERVIERKRLILNES